MDEYFYDLGTYSRKVSTQNAETQRWFNRGLIWSYSFDFEEAARCFEKAIEHDSDCAMAYWGLAYAVGPYYNKQWNKFDPVDLVQTVKRCNRAAQQALQRIQNANAVEGALIEAIVQRYPSDEPTDNFDVWNDHYANAMREVYRRFPQDSDVSTLFADALMNRTPWALWNLHTGEVPEGADTKEVISVLEKTLTHVEESTGENHPGALHMYIHVLEMSPFPERALLAADKLRNMVPDAGHLKHMPTHIDAQCGHYANVVLSNDAAIAADQKQIAKNGKINFRALSRAHNLHFKLYGAMFLGQYQAAMDAANGLVDTIPEELLRIESPPMADWLEGYVAMKIHAPIRFGKWQDIIEMPLPQDRELYCTTTSMLHYGKGLAHAVLGNVHQAEKEKERFHSSVTTVPETRTVFNNTCLNILAIASEMLSGEIEYRKNNFDIAFAHLRKAVQLADELPYDEPWGWMQPARHALGALLLEQGRVEEAEAEYRTDLGFNGSLIRACRHPDNVWSLHGLHECLIRQDKHSEANMIAPQLSIAMARADVPINASCLCRLNSG